MSLALLLPAALLAAPLPAADSRRELACAAAAGWIDITRSRIGSLRIIVSIDPPSLPEPGTKIEWKGGPGPAPEMLDALMRGGEANAVMQCPSLVAHLKRLHIPFGPKAVDRARPRHGGRAPLITSMSMPVLSADGTQALLISEGGQSIYWSGGLIHLRRDADGKWRQAATADLWYF